MELDDRLRRQLHEDAQRMTVGPADADLRTVRAAAARIERRRRAFTVSAAAAVLLVAGTVAVVVVGGSGGSSSIRSVTSVVPDGTEASDDGDDVTPTTSVESETAGTATAPAQQASTEPREVAALAYTTTPATAPPIEERTWLQWLFPWDDGFLAIGIRTHPQPLPATLPEDVAALFPPEVTELFADGRPATIDEATMMLSEAGLLDEVSQIISDHPEASAAIYAEPAAVDTLAWFSADGTSWDAVDFEVPDEVGSFERIVVSDGHLVGLSAGDQSVGLGVDTGIDTTLTVASTDDLQNWRTWSLDAGVVDDVVAVYGQSIAASADGWVAVVGVNSGPNGEDYTSQSWALSGDGTAVRTDVGTDGFVVGTSSGFLALGASPTVSADGLDWRRVGNLSESQWISSVWSIEDGFAVAVQDNEDGMSAFYLLSPSEDVWQPIVIPGAPPTIQAMYGPPSGGAQVIDAGTFDTTSETGSENPVVLQPDLWMMASDDGAAWLVHDMPDGESEDAPWSLAAVNGDVALVSSDSSSWLRFDVDS